MTRFFNKNDKNIFKSWVIKRVTIESNNSKNRHQLEGNIEILEEGNKN